MKKVILLMMFTLIVNVGLVFGQRRCMAVMPIDIIGNAVTQDEAEALTELYISKLIQADKVRIVDRGNFDKVMKELNFQNSDWSNSEKTAKLGRALNARFISRGKIMKLGKNYNISVSVIDITTSELVASSTMKSEDLDTIVKNLYKITSPIATDALCTKGPAGGTIFRFDGKYFYEAVFLTEEYTFSEASKYNGGFGGYYDWRLPNYDETLDIYYNLYERDRPEVDSECYWRENGNLVEYYVHFVTVPGYGLCSGKQYKTVFPRTAYSKFKVCLVRKFTD